MRYLLIHGEVLPMLQESAGALAATRGLLPLAKGVKVYVELAQALNIWAVASADEEALRQPTSGAPSWEERSGTTSWWPAEASGAPASGVAGHVPPSTTASGRASQAPEDDASGTPCGVGATTLVSPTSSDAYLPAPTLGARSALATRKGATTTGLS